MCCLIFITYLGMEDIVELEMYVLSEDCDKTTRQWAQEQEQLEYDLPDLQADIFERTVAKMCSVVPAQLQDYGKNALAFPHSVLCDSH